ncbi:MAG: hypothetical protein OJI67_11350 [Prosthecobacter sp.]|nr:hypothetical protein [Prosthecobacter sp.]
MMAKTSELLAGVGFVGTCLVTGALSLASLPGSLFGLGMLGAGIFVAGGAGAIAGATIGGAIDLAAEMARSTKDPNNSPFNVLKNALVGVFKPGPKGTEPETAAEAGSLMGLGLGVLAGYGAAIVGLAVWGAALVPALSAAALVVCGCAVTGSAVGWGVGKSIDIVKQVLHLNDKKESNQELPKLQVQSLDQDGPTPSVLHEKGGLKNTFINSAKPPEETIVSEKKNQPKPHFGVHP